MRSYDQERMEPTRLIELEDLDVSLQGRKVLRHINWRLQAGQNWAFLGPNGSGKSTLLRLIRGDIWPDAGRGRRIYRWDGRETSSPIRSREKIALVSPEYQAKYTHYEWALSGREVIQTGFFNSELLHQTPTTAQREHVEGLIERLHIADLAGTDVQRMSEGELRKILIARAMVNDPAVLILDEFSAGLDAVSRRHLMEVVENIAQSGTQILLTTHRPEELIPSVSHILILQDGQIRQQGERKLFQDLTPAGHSPHLTSPSGGGTTPLPPGGARGGQSNTINPTNPRPSTIPRPYLIRITNADVFIDDNRILRGINWQMGEDENWAICGRNGAGKSTLLKLILGELHPAWGGAIHRFNSTTREDMWTIKRKIGFVATDLQARYHEDLITEAVIASGFFATIGLIDEVTPEQWRRVHDLAALFKLEALAGQSILRMSYGQARRVLVARALATHPRLLLLDEPFDGLDRDSKNELTTILGHITGTGTRLILVSHHASDLLPLVTHGLFLDQGRIIEQGAIDDRNIQKRIERQWFPQDTSPT